MTEKQWIQLKNVINGERVDPVPIGFIIDCPWLPNWFGVKILDYFTSDELWFSANMKAIETFPDVMFLPGFWSEFGMCTEPSAFGSKCTFPVNEFPFARKVINTTRDVENLADPNPETDGLLPFVLNRLKLAQKKIEDKGHSIKFAVARGPFNIASFLMGATEFLTEMMMNPDMVHKLMKKITGFLKNWLELQMMTFPTIDGILLLDDIIGFIGGEQFKQFGFDYFKELYDYSVSVKFLHNDAACAESLKFLPGLGINLFNMAFDTDLNELKKETGNKVTMLGNIPPRDVLAAGSEEDVRNAVQRLIDGLEDTSRIILSCGGGIPSGVSTQNINAFISASR